MYNNPNIARANYDIITPNKLFDAHINELAERIKLEDVRRRTTEEVYSDILTCFDESFRNQRQSLPDSRAKDVFSAFVYSDEFKKDVEACIPDIREDIASDAIKSIDLIKIFEIADKYRVMCLILGDGYLGQMSEPCVLPDFTKNLPEKPWALTGKTPDRKQNKIYSLKCSSHDGELNEHNKKLFAKYDQIQQSETAAEVFMCDDAEYVICGYGTSARVGKKAVKMLREMGIKAGLFRPITLWPFPQNELENACKNAKKILTVEMSMGQMVMDIKLYSGHKVSDVDFYGEPGGVIPSVDVIIEKVKSYV